MWIFSGFFSPLWQENEYQLYKSDKKNLYLLSLSVHTVLVMNLQSLMRLTPDAESAL